MTRGCIFLTGSPDHLFRCSFPSRQEVQQGPQDPEAGHPRDASEEEGPRRGEEAEGGEGEIGGCGLPEAAGPPTEGAEGAPLRVVGQEALLLQAVSGTKEDVGRRVDVFSCHIFFCDARASTARMMGGWGGEWGAIMSPWVTRCLGS